MDVGEDADMIQSISTRQWTAGVVHHGKTAVRLGCLQAFSFPYVRPVILRCNLIVCLCLWIEQHAPKPTVTVSFSNLSMGLNNWGIFQGKLMAFKTTEESWIACSHVESCGRRTAARSASLLDLMCGTLWQVVLERYSGDGSEKMWNVINHI